MEKTRSISILNELKNTSSLNEKIEILKKATPEFKKILKYTYDDTYVYYIKKYNIPESTSTNSALEDVFNLLESLNKREVTGNAAISKVEKLFSELDHDNQILFDLILKRDLKAGVNKKLIEKVIPSLIFNIGYMGAVSFDPKKVNKLIAKEEIIYIQEKMDGEYSNLVINLDGSLEFYSRKNKKQTLPKVFIDLLKRDISKIDLSILEQKPIILNGELIIDGYDRYTANGLLTRLMNIAIKQQEYLDNENQKTKKAYEKAIKDFQKNYPKEEINDIYKKIRYIIWDYQNLDLDYKDRFQKLSIFEKSNFIKIVPTKEIHISNENRDSIYSELMKFFQEQLQLGNEGAIIKAGSGKWKSGKPVYQIKMKLDFECELRVKDFKPGKPGTKYENTLGAFICESEDGLLKTDPGGIDEDTRDEIWSNKEHYRNKIITVKCCGISKAKDKEHYSLLHPAFVKIREDKDKADTLEDIRKIQEGIIALS